MPQFTLELYRNSQNTTFLLADRQAWELEFRYICRLANVEKPPPRAPKNTKGKNLLLRLLNHQKE
jgi:hypothetical protein